MSAAPLPSRAERLLDALIADADYREWNDRTKARALLSAFLEEHDKEKDAEVARLKVALSSSRASVAEECAKACESIKGGYSANIRMSVDEPEFVRDPDGPWVLNSECAAACRAAGKEKP